MSYYECVRCNYIVIRNSDMVKHLNRKLKCNRNMASYKYSDEEIITLSLTIKKKVNIETKNIIKKPITCNDCGKIFTRIDNLKTHQKNSCKKIIKNNIQNIDNETENIQYNIHNIINVENITNNNFIILNKINIKSFDEKWTVEHIDEHLKQCILLSTTKYSDLLEEILKNKENLNVIIDKESSGGLVYKNDNDLYVHMKLKEIIEQSMLKLNEQLNLFYSSISDTTKINLDIINNEKKISD